MGRILIEDKDAEVANVVVDALEEAGYEPEEAIPGLVTAILALAEVTSDPEQALDEVANMIADS